MHTGVPETCQLDRRSINVHESFLQGQKICYNCERSSSAACSIAQNNKVLASGILPHQTRQQMPQQSQLVFTPVIALGRALVVGSTPPRENMGHSWHFPPKARSSDAMTNSLPATSTVVCRGTQSCPEPEPSLIRADGSKTFPGETRKAAATDHPESAQR